jgi:Rieske 2Fe-2S family protein
MESIWRQGWLFAGHSCQIPNPGDYFLYEVDGDSVIIMRGDDGQVKPCTTFAATAARSSARNPGHVKRFVCPYHQWTYDRNGRLLLQRGMQPDLDKSQLRLHAAHAREVEG